MSRLMGWVGLGLENYKAILSIITLIIGLIGTNVFQHIHSQELMAERDDSNTALTQLSKAVNESASADNTGDTVHAAVKYIPCRCKGLVKRIEKLEYLHN